jgi:hypothetical protein
VLRGLQLLNQSGLVVLGSTPLPRANGAQLKSIGRLYHQPPITEHGGQEMEGGRYRHNQISAGSGQLPGGKSKTAK